MALTESNDLPIGSAAPDFRLLASSGEKIALQDYTQAKGLVVMFICNHCPYVIHIADSLAQTAREYQARGIEFVAINSNDAEAYPADSYENMKLEHEQRGYSFAYLYDETQAVAKAYRAACTPDIYLFDGEHKLFYHGQYDQTRPHRISSGNYDSSAGSANGEDLRCAMDCLLGNQSLDRPVYPAMGCNIKWKS